MKRQPHAVYIGMRRTAVASSSCVQNALRCAPWARAQQQRTRSASSIGQHLQARQGSTALCQQQAGERTRGITRRARCRIIGLSCHHAAGTVRTVRKRASVRAVRFGTPIFNAPAPASCSSGCCRRAPGCGTSSVGRAANSGAGMSKTLGARVEESSASDAVQEAARYSSYPPA